MQTLLTLGLLCLSFFGDGWLCDSVTLQIIALVMPSIFPCQRIIHSICVQ